jgi:signal transduction histidine kinase
VGSRSKRSSDGAEDPGEALARAEAEARARARLVSMAVHDLRNPLASILGNAEYLTQARELTADSREAVTDLLASARLFVQILAELRAVSRGLGRGAEPPAHMGPVALGPVAHAAVLAASPRAARAEVRLVCQVDEPLSAHADPDLLRHVVDDLVDNALRNSPARSEVMVTASRRDATALLSVADHRVPPVSVEHLFDIEVGDAASGRRLALIFSRVACEAQGGTLRAEVTPDGLAMTIELPAIVT